MPCDMNSLEPFSKVDSPGQSICIIVVYFGGWPIYFDLFLNSCANNPDIEFLFFSDCGITKKMYILPNCRYYHLTLKDFNQLASERLKLNIKIDSPYKICDLRPSYGEIFNGYISGFDFWGNSDIDLVYGQIRKFFTNDVLQKYDALFVRKEYTTGSLFLMKNKPKMNALYKQSPDYIKVFEDSQNFYSFCECGKAWEELRKGKSIFDINIPIVSFTELVKIGEKTHSLKPLFKTIALEMIPRSREVIYDHGRVFCNSKEYILYHYISEKSSSLFTFPRWREIPPKYKINRYGAFKIEQKGGFGFILVKRGHQVVFRLKKKIQLALKLILTGRWNEILSHARIILSRMHIN